MSSKVLLSSNNELSKAENQIEKKLQRFLGTIIHKIEDATINIYIYIYIYILILFKQD